MPMPSLSCCRSFRQARADAKMRRLPAEGLKLVKAFLQIGEFQAARGNPQDGGVGVRIDARIKGGGGRPQRFAELLRVPAVNR